MPPIITTAEEADQALQKLIQAIRRSGVVPLADLISTLNDEVELLRDFEKQGEEF